MKSRKVKAYNASKRRKADIPLEASDDSDINSDSFYQDEIDDFNNKKDDELSTDDELIQKKEDSSEEEEVLPITDDEKEESEEEEDDDDHQQQTESEDDDLPNRDAWGKKKSIYYSADFVDQDWGRTYREKDAEAAKAEEEEALVIQKKEKYYADNLGPDSLFESSEESAEEEEIVKKDGETKEDIIKYLKKETKFFEYKALLESSIQKLKKLLKLWHLIQTKKIRSKRIESYVRVKKQVLHLIVHNVNMYYYLLSTGKCQKHHPVNKSIAYFKQLLDDLESRDHVLVSAIDQLLEIKEDELDISSDLENDIQTPESIPTSSKDIPVVNGATSIKKKKVKHMETETEKEVMSLFNEVKEEMRKRKLKELEKDDDLEESKNQPKNDDEANVDEKRVISYEIAKNKGLVPHRKKEYRNPRVRHRMKYRKAQIRRKGQVRNVIKEVKKYEGEPTGINVNVVKSVKFK